MPSYRKFQVWIHHLIGTSAKNSPKMKKTRFPQSKPPSSPPKKTWHDEFAENVFGLKVATKMIFRHFWFGCFDHRRLSSGPVAFTLILAFHGDV